MPAVLCIYTCVTHHQNLFYKEECEGSRRDSPLTDLGSIATVLGSIVTVLGSIATVLGSIATVLGSIATVLLYIVLQITSRPF